MGLSRKFVLFAALPFDQSIPLATISSMDFALPQQPRPQIECPFDKIFPSQLQRDDEFFMKLAYNQAIDAWREDEVPIGAVIEYGGDVVAATHNRVDGTKDPTAHAEVIALTQASHAVCDWRLNGATLYVTKEPCPMCSGALIMARVSRVVYAVRDPKMGLLGGAMDISTIPTLNHKLIVESGVLEAECRTLIQAYFQMKRVG